MNCVTVIISTHECSVRHGPWMIKDSACERQTRGPPWPCSSSFYSLTIAQKFVLDFWTHVLILSTNAKADIHWNTCFFVCFVGVFFFTPEGLCFSLSSSSSLVYSHLTCKCSYLNLTLIVRFCFYTRECIIKLFSLFARQDGVLMKIYLGGSAPSRC